VSNGVECSLNGQHLTEYDSIMAQVFVVVAAGSVIGFIVRDLGDGAIAGMDYTGRSTPPASPLDCRSSR
jgi:hypothetical protein